MSAQFLTIPRPRFRTPSISSVEQFALDVREGLSRFPKELPSRYLYDEVGSALFDVITLLPEYGLTRADERLLRRNAEAIALRLAPNLVVAELGSGSGRKTRPILQAICGLQRTVDYYAIDGSATALERCRKELAGVPGAYIHTLESFYEEGLEQVAQQRLDDQRLAHQRLLVLFLGSSIGNFDRAEAAALPFPIWRCSKSCLGPFSKWSKRWSGVSRARSSFPKPSAWPKPPASSQTRSGSTASGPSRRICGWCRKKSSHH